jgi:hypothetical protein
MSKKLIDSLKLQIQITRAALNGFKNAPFDIQISQEGIAFQKFLEQRITKLEKHLEKLNHERI